VAIIGALDLPQCKKYRVIQKTEQLDLLGFKSIISSIFDVPRAIDSMQLASSIIFYRVPDSFELQKYILEARRLSLPIGYDVDDPIFDREIYKNNHNLDFLESNEKRRLLSSTTSYLKAMRACDFCIVSTPKMKDVANKYIDNPIFLWRNVIDADTRSQIANLNLDRCKCKDGCVSISYMSGSRAHEADFEQITNPILTVMKEYPQTRLLIGGYTRLPKQFYQFIDRIVVKPFMDYRGYFNFLADSDINLVPLVIDEFNDCKSAIRFLEASILAKPTIVSNIGDFKNMIVDGDNGYTASSDEQWYDRIKTLIESKELRLDLGKNAMEYVLSNQTSQFIVHQMDSQLKQLLMGKNE
jgi:glycosyltransferase involved in cell wall biosynthesis